MQTRLFVVCLIAIAACAQGPGGSSDRESSDRSEPDTSVVSSELGNACTIQCRNANLQCNSVCERFPRPNCEENCDARFLNCMRACGCPFTEEFDRTVGDHADPTNQFICVGDVPRAGLTYQVYNTFIRTEHVRRTLSCDNVTSEVVLSSVVSPSGPCSHRLFPDLSCPRSDFFPQSICTF